MRNYVDSTFQKSVIKVDGNQYKSCSFIECKIVYTGVSPVSFDNCTFDKCTWVLDGAAGNTLNFLRAIYQGLGTDGEDMVEAIFSRIKDRNIED